MPSAGWPSMHNCFNRLEDSNKYSAGVLETNVAKIRVLLQERVSKVKCYTYHGNHVFYIMATIISLLSPPCISLRWCPDAVIIFLIYLSMHTYVHISTVKHPKQKMVQQIRSGTSRQGCLPLRHYCMMLLLVLLGFDAPSSDYLAKRLTHLLVKPTE